MVGNYYTLYIVALISGFILLTQVLKIDCLSYSRKTTYAPANLGTSCKDKDVCQEMCIDSPSGPLCTCSEGRYLSTDNKTCTDIPYCQQWGRCSQICYMSNTSYSCGCSFGYKLAHDKFSCISKDPFATSLLLAAGNEIIIYSLQNQTYSPVLSCSSKITAVDYYHSPTSNLLFWADYELKTIFAGLLIGNSKVLQNVHPIVQGGLTVVTSIAVDWVTHNLYWTDAKYHHLEVSKFDGTMRTVLVADIPNPQSLAVDPKHGLMFWSSGAEGMSKIERSALNGDQRQVLVTQFQNDQWPTGITLEYAMMHLYWVDNKLDIVHVVNYNGENHRIIYRDVRSSLFSLSVFENYIYWTSERGSLGRVNRWNSDDNEILTFVYPQPYDLKVLHPLRQPSGRRNPCAYKNGHCAHLCLFNNNLQASCACSYGWKLNEDGRTCSKYKEYFTYALQEKNEIFIFFSQRQNLNHFIFIPITVSVDDGYSNVIYDPKSEQVFWANRNILKTVQHNGSNKTVLELDQIEIISIAADSGSDNLYLLTSSTSGEESYLSLCTKMGSYFTHLIKFHHTKPLHISVDPINRVLIWSQIVKWNENKLYTLESSLLDGSDQKRILQLNVSEDFSNPLRFTLHSATCKIYLWGDDSGDLLWTTYNGSSLHVIPNIRPSAIAVDNNSIIYIQNNTVYEMSGNSSDSIGNISGKVVHMEVISQYSVPDRPSNPPQTCDTILIQVSFNHDTCVPKIGSKPFLAFLHNGQLKSSSFSDGISNFFSVKLFTTSSTDDFDIDHMNSMIYWTDSQNKAIFSMKTDGTQKHLLVHVDGHIGQIAYDWIDGYLYWISKNDSAIWVTDSNGKYKYVVIQDNLKNPSAIAVDPVHGYLFWADSGASAHIERSLLSGARRKVLASVVSAHINCLTIEVKEMMVYWTDFVAGTAQRMTFDGLSQETLISKGESFIVHPVSLAVNNEYLFFADIGSRDGCIIQVKKNNLSDVTVIGENYGRNLARIKLFDIKLQEGTNACIKRRHGCEHLCFYEGSKKYSCACAYSMLGDDKKHCIEYKQFMLLAEGEKIISLSLTDPISLNAPFPPLVIGEKIQKIAALSYNRYQKKIIFSDLEQKPYLFSIKIDGTGLTPLLKDGFVRCIEGLAFDEVHGDIYWTDSARPSIFSLRIVQHGTTQHYPFEAEKILELDSLDKPRGIVVHSCYLYLFWTNWRKNYPTIERAYFTGAQREIIVSDGLVQPNGIVIDLIEEMLIWADANLDDKYFIWSCNLDGSKRKQISYGGGHHPFDIVIHGSFLYWTDWETGSLLQTEKTSGKGPAIIRSNLLRPTSLVVEPATPLMCPPTETKPPAVNSSSHCYGYCHNNALCITNEQSGKVTCICTENFTGSNCDVEIHASTFTTNDKRASSPTAIPITVLVVIIFICAALGIVLCSRQHCSRNGNTLPLLKNSHVCNQVENMTRESSFCNGSCEEDGILISPASEAVTFKKTNLCRKESSMML